MYELIREGKQEVLGSHFTVNHVMVSWILVRQNSTKMIWECLDPPEVKNLV